jgi:hypothetical protein
VLVLALLPLDSGLTWPQRAGLVVIGVGLVLGVAVRVALWNTRRVARRRARAATARLVADTLHGRAADRGRHRRADG